MENTKVAKGVALFATLIGIYNWVGQGASIFDILILTFAAVLILSVDSEKRSVAPEHIEPSENPSKKGLFSNLTLPLRPYFLTWRKHENLKPLNLNPFYSFSFN